MSAPSVPSDCAAAQLALYRQRDVLHLANAEHGRTDEERASPGQDDRKERARLGPEALHRPAGEEVVIAGPADAREHGAGQREAPDERACRATRAARDAGA